MDRIYPRRPPPLPAEVAERRAARRVPARVRVDVVQLASSDRAEEPAAPFEASTEDLSEAGLRIRPVGIEPVGIEPVGTQPVGIQQPTELEVGTVLQLYMRVPDGLPHDRLSCYGRVVRRNATTAQPTFGLRLFGLAPSETLRLRHYTERMSGASDAARVPRRLKRTN